MKWNTPLYFLPCFFSCTMLVVFLEQRIIRRKSLYRVYAIACLAIVGWILSKYLREFILPYSLEVAINMSVWMELAIEIKENAKNHPNILKKLSHKYNIILSVIVSSFLGSIGAHFNGLVGVRTNDSSSYIPYLMTAAFFINAVIMVAILLEKCRVLQYIGKHTLIILMFHKFIILFFTVIFPVSQKMYSGCSPYTQLMLSIAVTVAAIFSCIILGEILNMLFNRKRKK